VEAEPYERMWTVVKRNGVLLQEGDTFKLGKQHIRVKAVGVTGKEQHSWCPAPVPVRTYADSSRRDPGKCRICLGDEDCEEDPLICPCECLGSVQYIHVKCLQEWLKTRAAREIPTTSITAYELKSQSCELCKAVLPAAITLAGKTQVLIEALRPTDPFIVVEVLSSRREGAIHVLSMLPSNSVYIGRSPNCEAVLSDMSVSRCHAAITLQPTGFCLRDLKSKFGTLMEIREPAVILKPGSSLTLQCGRTLVTLKACQPARWLYFCCRCCYPSERVRPEVTLVRHATSSVFQTTIQHAEEYAGQEQGFSEEDRTRLVIT
jgi:hypothetical protein